MHSLFNRLISRSRFSPLLWAALFAVLLAACSSSPTSDDADAVAVSSAGNLTDGCIENFEEGRDYFPDKVAFDHAGSVDVTYSDTYKVVTVRPAANEGDVQPVSFVLVQCGAPAPELTGELAGARMLAVPVKTVVSLTTTNLPHFAQLDATDRLVGVGTPGFVATPEVIARIEAGAVTGFADANGQAELEKVVAAQPDVLIMDAFGGELVAEMDRFAAAGVTAVLNADFNEQTLLGRAEWLKFTALLLNAEANANDSFSEISSAYQDVLDVVPADGKRPSVFVNTPWEGTWYTPGGASYLAHAIAEAGGAYVLADDTSTFSLQLDMETALAKASDADVWLQAGSVHGTLDDLVTQDERFANFAALRSGQVWAYDKWTTEGGGNAVFEVAYARPDQFLADLVAILHPDALPEHETLFFGQVAKA